MLFRSLREELEQGETALEFFTEVKSVYVDYTGQARKGSLY